MSEHKSCPFCDSREVFVEDNGDYGHIHYWVFCNGAGFLETFRPREQWRYEPTRERGSAHRYKHARNPTRRLEKIED